MIKYVYPGGKVLVTSRKMDDRRKENPVS